MACFVKALDSRTPASVTATVTQALPTMSINFTNYLELRDLNADKVTLYVRGVKFDLKYNDTLVNQLLAKGMSREQITQQENQIKQMMLGTATQDGSCVFVAAKLRPVLQRWADGTFADGDYDQAESCGGPAFKGRNSQPKSSAAKNPS